MCLIKKHLVFLLYEQNIRFEFLSVSEFMEAIEELAIHLADFSISEQDNSVLLRYFFIRIT